MSIDRPTSAGPKILVSILFCTCAMLSSCSTVRTFLSNLDAASFSTEGGTKDRKIPLPPMAEEYGTTDVESPPQLDVER